MKFLTEHIKRVSLALVALSSAIGYQPALAAGTAADTQVSNTATVTYSVNSVTQSPVSSLPTTFKVDKKVDVAIAQIAAATTQPNTSNVAVAFDVKNEGNSADSFTFTQALSSGVTLNNVRIYRDNTAGAPATIGVWDAGDILITPATTAVSFTNELVDATNATKRFFIVSDIPNTATNGQTAVYTLTATTTSVQNSGAADDPNNTAGPDVVFAEGSGPTYDGAISANETYTINAAALTVSKTSQVVSDGLGAVAPNAKAIPGATIEYTITVSNAVGAQPATGVTISDAGVGSVFASGLVTYVPGSMKLGATLGTLVSLTDAADADAGTVSGGPVNSVQVAAGTINAGAQQIVRFRVTVN